MSGSVIVAGARTPMGRLLGGLKDRSGAQLGGVAIKAALEKAGISGDQVQYVIMGQVLQAGAGQLPARQAAYEGGIPLSVPSISINKVCLSGINAIAMADQLIRAGVHEIVVAGGMESMTQAPHLLPRSREGVKYGDTALVDSMAYDALYDQLTGQAMIGADGDLQRRRRPAHPRGAGRVRGPLAPAGCCGLEERRVRRRGGAGGGPAAQGRPGRGLLRRGRSRATPPSTRCRGSSPAYTEDGTITAGSASQISDGACAVVVMSKAKAEELGLSWIAEIGASGQVAGPDDSTLQMQPANAIAQACEKEGIEPADLDLVEINEAFASVGIVSARALDLDEDKVNVNGGAIALGHPVGMSGARITLHLALELQRRGGGTGAAALCGGGGQGDALILHVPAAG